MAMLTSNSEEDEYDENLPGYDEFRTPYWDTDEIVELIRSACQCQWTAWTLDKALHGVQAEPLGADGKVRVLSTSERNRVLEALIVAKVAIPPLIPYYPEQLITDGLDAVMYQVIYWAETKAERAAARDPDMIRDAHDVIRILRNHLHCVRMRARIKERADAREQKRSAVIDSLFGQHLKRGTR